LFDDRVITRLGDLMEADLNDPVVRQIILAARKAAAAAALAAKNKHAEVEEEDPFMSLTKANAGPAAPPPPKRKIKREDSSHDLKRVDTSDARGRTLRSSSSTNLLTTSQSRPFSSDDAAKTKTLGRSASTTSLSQTTPGKLKETMQTPGGPGAGGPSKMLEVAATYGKIVAENMKLKKPKSATGDVGAMAVRAKVHEAKELKELPRDGVLAHHKGDSAHYQKPAPKAVETVQAGSTFARARTLLEPLPSVTAASGSKPGSKPPSSRTHGGDPGLTIAIGSIASDQSISTDDMVAAALSAANSFNPSP
jgi:hypothetical protein